MSHPNQIKFVQIISDTFNDELRNGRVLEVGSYSVNGEIRQIFEYALSYTGIDLASGPGVDEVCSGHEYRDDINFDMTISCEAFEHNPVWLETFINMIILTRPGGLVVFTCASKGRLEHGTFRTDPLVSPGTSSIGLDYYKNLVEKNFTSKMDMQNHFQDWNFYYMSDTCDLYFVGRKRHDKSGTLARRIDPKIQTVRNRMREYSYEFRSWKYFLRRVPLVIIRNIAPDHIYQEIALRYMALTDRIRGLLFKM